MIKKLFLLTTLRSIVSLLVISCNRNKFEAKKPIYLSIPSIELSTDYISEGSAHHKINTVWVVVNNREMGTFDLPCIVPTNFEKGINDILLFPGIFLNGNSSVRAIYEPYNVISLKLDYSDNRPSPDTLTLDSADLVTTYNSAKKIIVLEDFDKPGINLEATSRSDTEILKTNDLAKIFVNLQTIENNGKAGEIILADYNDLAEFSTAESYDINVNRADAYVEISYRSNAPIIVGVIANLLSEIVQAPTAVILPKDEWNKIYINLITEITTYANAASYKIFVGVNKPSNLDTARVYLDNIKLVY